MTALESNHTYAPLALHGSNAPNPTSAEITNILFAGLPRLKLSFLRLGSCS
jgi:hypothetical protein